MIKNIYMNKIIYVIINIVINIMKNDLVLIHFIILIVLFVNQKINIYI